MGRLNDKDVKSNALPLYGWGKSLDLTGKGYPIAKRVWKTYADLEEYVNNPNDSALPGIILSVIDNESDEGLYYVKAIKGTHGADKTIIEKIGGLDLAGYVTEEWINEQGFITSVQPSVETGYSDDNKISVTVETEKGTVTNVSITTNDIASETHLTEVETSISNDLEKLEQELQQLKILTYAAL